MSFLFPPLNGIHNVEVVFHSGCTRPEILKLKEKILLITNNANDR